MRLLNRRSTTYSSCPRVLPDTSGSDPDFLRVSSSNPKAAAANACIFSSRSLRFVLSIRDTRTAPDAYAEAWALNYYLLHQRPRQYVAYLQMLSHKKELLWDDPQTRLAEFQAAFGENLGQLDADFLRYIRSVR